MIMERRHYQQIASILNDILLDTKPEQLEIATSLFLRIAHGLAMRNSNMQIGRFMDAAGIPSSTSPAYTKRGD